MRGSFAALARRVVSCRSGAATAGAAAGTGQAPRAPAELRWRKHSCCWPGGRPLPPAANGAASVAGPGSLEQIDVRAEWVLRLARTMRVRGYGAERFFARPRGGGGERRDWGDQPSEVVTNVAKGEKLKMREVSALKGKPVLYVRSDGTREEVTMQAVLAEAREQGLDPVIVSGLNGDNMPVMKLMDVGRTRHDMQKKKRESSKKNTGAQALKELRFGLNIDQNDLKTKMKQAVTFLEKGHRVKIFMQLKGADYHRNQKQALARLDEIAALVGDAGMQDGKTSISGHVVSTTLAPRPAGAGNKPKASDGGGGGGGGSSSKGSEEKSKDDDAEVAMDPSSPADVAKQVCFAAANAAVR